MRRLQKADRKGDEEEMSVIDSYRKELQHHIDMGVDKHFLGFVVKETLKGNFNEEGDEEQ